MSLTDGKSTNPMMQRKVLDRITEREGQMSVNGTIGKTAWLLLITVVTAACSWKFMLSMEGAMMPVLFVSLLVGAGLFFYTTRNPQNAHITAPIYAMLEGLFVGVATALYGSQVEGIVFNAVVLTFGIMGLMLFVYRTGLIKVTEKFKMVMAMLIGAIGILYLTTWIVGFMGIHMAFMHDSSPLGIGINIAIIVVASLTFLLDFDMIEKNVASKVPKKVEWLGAMSLLATIVWLYVELLKLLARIQD